MKKEFILAFDQGTTSTRAILFDKKGNIAGVSQREFEQIYPKQGWVEHNAEVIFKDTKEVFDEVLKKTGILPEQIDSIGITNQRETTVVWDKNTGKPIYNAIVWLDKRTTAICQELREDNLEYYIKKNTGLVIDSYFSGTKIKWILNNVEGAREKASRGELLFGTIDTWLIWKFTNGTTHATDHTNASRTLLYNIVKQEWDSLLLSALQIPESMLPEVKASSSNYGNISKAGVKIPICGVAGDQQASLFGQGGQRSGIAKNTYGTGCFMLMNIGKKPLFSNKGLLTTLSCTMENKPIRFALEGSIFVGGASVQWLRDKMKIINDASETEGICMRTPSQEGLYVVPAFAGLGAPHWDMDARGSIYGLNLDSGKDEIVKATIDAIAYQTRDVLEAMIEDSGKQMKVLRVDGGASANNYLMQFQADILGVKVNRPKMLEVTALGAALLAGIKTGFWKEGEIETIRESDQLFKPIITEYKREQLYQGWQKAVNRTKVKVTALSEQKGEDSMRFSVLDRSKQLKKIKNTLYDLIVIGGGVTGAGIALDAASRGLSVCLVEKNDFASGTSSKSTKLIHGGLRYLKQLEFGLVAESGSERAIVHNLAPHLILPEKMLLPLVKGGSYSKLMTSVGLSIYDFLAQVEGNDRRKMLSKEDTLSKEPLLDEEKLLGSGYYSEYRTDDARLTIELLKKAAFYGADILNYCEVTNFNYFSNGKIESIECKDYNSSKVFEIEAKSYISAAGPWVDLLRDKDKSKNRKYLHLTKGVHIVFPNEKFPLKQAIYFDVPDGRMIFAIPRGRATYVGTTDTNYEGSLNRVIATKDDANYLLSAVNSMFPTLQLKIEDIESNWSGLRPLIHKQGKDPSELSRKDEIFVSNSGLVSIAGGKLTGYRKMAQRVIDVVLKKRSREKNSKIVASFTEHLSLTNKPLKNTKAVKKYITQIQNRLLTWGIKDSYCSWYLVTTYGKQTDIILDKVDYFISNSVEESIIRAELWYCIHNEMIHNMTDFFVRRTGRLYFDIPSVIKYKDLILNDLIRYLKWDEAKLKEETSAFDLMLKDATTYYENEIN